METPEEVMDDAYTVAKNITAGEYDAELENILATAQERKRALALKQGWTLRPGDRVEVISGRPRYLIGETATVVKVMQSYVNIKFDRQIGRFSGGSVRCPMTMIRKIPAN